MVQYSYISGGEHPELHEPRNDCLCNLWALAGEWAEWNRMEWGQYASMLSSGTSLMYKSALLLMQAGKQARKQAVPHASRQASLQASSTYE